MSAQTLAKYTSVVPLGGAGYVRLGDQGWGCGAEGEWNIYVSGHQPCPIEAHPDTPQGWKVEFVEELPNWETSGAKTIGVRVTVPKGARQAVLNGVTAGLFHTRDGVQLYFSDSFQVAYAKSHPFNRCPSRSSAGRERAHAAPPLNRCPSRQVLGVSERMLRRRVADGKIEAVKNTSPATGAAWFIERATIDALKAPSLSSVVFEEGAHKEEQEEVQALAQVTPEQSSEIVRLRDDVQQIKAFLLGQAMAEQGEGLPADLGTVIGQAMRETLAPLVERIEQQSAENALLKQQLGQAQAREQQNAHSRSWWPFRRRRE